MADCGCDLAQSPSYRQIFFQTCRFPFQVMPPLLRVPTMPPQPLTWTLRELLLSVRIYEPFRGLIR
jgi:hypothetical protein